MSLKFVSLSVTVIHFLGINLFRPRARHVRVNYAKSFDVCEEATVFSFLNDSSEYIVRSSALASVPAYIG